MITVLTKNMSCFTIVSRGVKTVASKAKGEAVKRLNKENKDLFGELLETQKIRREKILQHDTVEVNTNVQHIAKDKKIYTSVGFHEINENDNIVFDEQSLIKAFNDDDFKQTALARSRDTQQLVPSLAAATLVVRNYKNNSVEKKTASKKVKTLKEKENLTPEVAKIIKKAPTKSVLKTTLLPDSVIQNITSFPMVNLSKTEPIEIPAAITNDLWKYPSVSKVLNATMSEGSRAALARWRSKLIEQLGEEGFMKYYRAQLNRGSQFHSTMQNFLSGKPLPDDLDPEIEACWASLSSVLGHVSNVAALESPVVHSQLLYKGVIDCVANFNGEPVIVEWKKSAKHKPQLHNTYDAPLQLAAYMGAMSFDPSYKLKITGGVVAVAYSDGTPAECFHLNLDDFTPHWQAWLTRLQKYWLLMQQQQEKETS